MKEGNSLPSSHYKKYASPFWLSLLVLTIFFSVFQQQEARCQVEPERDRVSAIDLIKGEFLVRRGRSREALSLYRTLSRFPVDDERKGFVYFRIAGIEYALGAYELAYENIEKAVLHLKGKFNLYSAMFLRMKIFIEMGWFREARQVAAYLVDARFVGAPKVDLYILMGETDTWLEDAVSAVGEYEKAYLMSDLERRAEIYRNASLRLSKVLGKVSDPFVYREALSNSKTLQFRAFITYMAGKNCLNAGYFGFARHFIDKFLNISGFTGEYEKGMELLRSLSQKREGRPVILAYLPFNGPHSEISMRILAGLELSLKKDPGSSFTVENPFFIDVRDTGEELSLLSSDEGLERLPENVIAVVGPLTGREAYFVDPGYDTPLIFYLGQRYKYGGRGFVNYGLRPDQEARKLASFAFASGVHSPLILYPENGYGNAYRDALMEELKNFSLSPFRSVGYPPDSKEFTYIFKGIVGSEKFAEYSSIEDKGVFMPVPFDGVFILDFPERGYLIHSQMAYNNIKTPSFSPSSWIDIDFLKEKGKDLKGVWMVSDYNPFSSSVESKKFLRGFTDSYSIEPDRFAGYGYDLGKLFGSFIARSSVTGITMRAMRHGLKREIYEVGKYSGVTGEVLFRPEGGTIRILSVIEENGGRFREARIPLY